MTPEQILKDAIRSLSKEYELVYIDYDSKLSDDEIPLAICGDWETLEGHLDEWVHNTRYDTAMYYIDEILDEDEKELLKDADLLDELRYAIEERDTSNPLDRLCKLTPNVMVRYRAEDLKDEVDKQLTFEHNDEGWSDVDSLYVYWSGNVWQLFQTALDNPGLITWKDPNLLFFDRMNGSGYHVEATGTLTLPYQTDRMGADIGRYSYADDVCGGLHKPAFECEVTFTTYEQMIESLTKMERELQP